MSSSAEPPVPRRRKICGYPLPIFFIIGNEFCERYSYYGMKSILAHFLKYELKYDELVAKEIYHTFVLCVYLFPIFGAMIADSWLGTYKTILYVSIIHLIGNSMMAVAALTFMPMRVLTLIGLLVIAIGTGGIKPCVAAFGGDQFQLPEDKKQFEKFFGWFYFSISCGSFISTIISPILRNNVHCFGRDNCFPLAFVVPAILMFISLIIFWVGRKMYNIKKPQGNLIIRIIGCLCHATRNRIKQRAEPRKRCLDYASDKYNEIFINNLRLCGRILLIFIPIPMFWALYDQHGSGWTFMATRMNGDVGAVTILPDQFQVANTILILVLIPLFDYVIYPLLAKKNILKKLLHRILVGGICAVISFIISGVIQIELEKEYPVFPEKGEAQVRFYNSLPCKLQVTSSSFNGIVNELSVTKVVVKLEGQKVFTYKGKPVGDAVCYTRDGANNGDLTGEVNVTEKQMIGVHFTSQPSATVYNFKDSIDKHKDGFPTVRNMVSFLEDKNISYESSTLLYKFKAGNHSVQKLRPDTYTVKIGDKLVGQVTLRQGGVYSLLISAMNLDSPKLHKQIITPPNTIHMLWLTPQYFLITVAEILISITCYEFAYSQAPANMKSLMQSVTLLTSAFGNLYILIVGLIESVVKQSTMYFIWACLMFLDMLLFIWITWNYKYVEKHVTMDEILAAEEADKAANK